VSGITAAAAGAIAGAAFVIGRKAIIDLPTIGIAAIAFLLLVTDQKAPESVVIVGAGVLGLLLRPT
jgi:chromate transporter